MKHAVPIPASQRKPRSPKAGFRFSCPGRGLPYSFDNALPSWLCVFTTKTIGSDWE
jgi:hypothetical protein